MAGLPDQRRFIPTILTEFGEADAKCRRADIPEGLAFMAFGSACNRLVGGETYASGMPDSKHLKLEITLIAEALRTQRDSEWWRRESMSIKRRALAVVLIVIAAGLIVFQVVSDRYHVSTPQHLLVIVPFLCFAAIIILATGRKKWRHDATRSIGLILQLFGNIWITQQAQADWERIGLQNSSFLCSNL
jgi:hypothetical protein